MCARKGLCAFAGVMMCGLAGSVVASITVTGNNGAPIDPSNYTITWNGGRATIDIISGIQAATATSRFTAPRTAAGTG